MSKPLDLIGKRFGRLVAIERSGRGGGLDRRRFKWKCKCDCGNVVHVIGTFLKSDNTQSCGCLNIERNIEAHTKHGLRRHQLYHTWAGMKNRCDPANKYKKEGYSDRGIDICKEWEDDFQTFYNWAVSNGWRPGLQIDRENNDKGYYPNNCRFVIPKISSQNTRRSKVWVIYGKKYLSANEAAQILGVHRSTIHAWCGVSKGKMHRQRSGCYAYLKYAEAFKGFQ